jgi:O-antigen/teichoic acid export membrane protein
MLIILLLNDKKWYYSPTVGRMSFNSSLASLPALTMGLPADDAYPTLELCRCLMNHIPAKIADSSNYYVNVKNLNFMIEIATEPVTSGKENGNAIGKTIIHRIISNFGWSIVNEVLTKVVTFLTNIYLARVLSVAGFGMLAVAQTVTAYFWVAVDLGISMYGIREIAKNRESADEIIRPLLTLRITAGVIIFVLFNAVLFLSRIPTTEKIIYFGSSTYLVSYAFYTDWILKGIEKFKYIAIGSSLYTLTYLILTLSLVNGPHDIFIASLLPAISYLTGSSVLIYYLNKVLGIRIKLSFDLKTWYVHLKESIYFTISSGFMLLYQLLPILLLRSLYSPYEVGLFSAAYRIVMAVIVFGGVLTASLYPIFSDLYRRDIEKFKSTRAKFNRMMFSAGLPVAAFGTIFGDSIIRTLLGNQYAAASQIFKILVWIIPLIFLRYSYGSALLAAGLQRIHNVASFLGLVCMCACGFLLIPHHKVAGAGYALLLSEAVMLVSMIAIFNKKIARINV